MAPGDLGVDAGVTDSGPTDVNPGDANLGDAAGADAGVVGTTLIEDRRVYDADDWVVRELQVTVADLGALAAIEANDPGASAAAVLREGTFEAPATLELRGATTRFTEQKSYRLKLDDPNGRWRGQRVINLNKHPYDLTRARNALAFVLLREVEHATSLRVSFVHLTINGEDRGLFTQIEQPNRLFLEGHGLDPNGWLYKANNFTFYPLPPEAWTDPLVFESALESKGQSDHSPLQAMLAAVNDDQVDIDQVIAEHFERDNYETWLAFNLLLGNWDTISQNFYLYRKSGGGPFYFLPWDYDGALGFDEQPGNPARPRWQAGLATWWEVPLHRRYLMKPENRGRVWARFEALYQQLAPRAPIILAELAPVIRRYVSVEPDVEWLPLVPPADLIEERLAQFEAEVDRLSRQLNTNHDEALAVAERPMPIWLGEPSYSGGAVTLFWDPSFDLQGDGLRYDLLVGDTPSLSNLRVERRELSETSAELVGLGPGTYYWTVRVLDPDGDWQSPFDLLEEGGLRYDGVRRFEAP